MSLPTLWLLSDGAAGNAVQAAALARALGLSGSAITLSARAPWRWFAPRRWPGARRAFGPSFADRLDGALPDLAIGCGRQAALALRLLRTASRGRCRTVQILDPRIAARHFDAVVVPRHDRLRGANVVTTLGALHAVDAATLDAARRHWPALGALPRPRTALLLGGPTRAARLDPRWWQDMATCLEHWLAREGGSLLLTTSRRTPDWLRDAARARFAQVPGVRWSGPDDGPNPYAAFLAWADRIVVSPDSVNLLSEACATEAPVFTALPHALSGKLAAFHADLRAAGRLRTLTPEPERWAVTPLRDTATVAARLRPLLGLD